MLSFCKLLQASKFISKQAQYIDTSMLSATYKRTLIKESKEIIFYFQKKLNCQKLFIMYKSQNKIKSNMAELLLKAVDYKQTLKKIYQSCRSTLLPIISDYRKGAIPSKWIYFKLIVKETYVILLEAGIIQLLEQIIVTFVCPGIGNVIVSLLNILTEKVSIEAIEKSIHQDLDKYQAQYAKNVLAPEHKPVQAHHGIYNKVMKELKLPSDTPAKKALEVILQKKAKLEADPAQSVWEILKIYKKEMIVLAYC